MNYQQFIDIVQDLSDLELATLLCLVAKEHCLIEANDELIDDLAAELALVRSTRKYYSTIDVLRPGC